MTSLLPGVILFAFAVAAGVYQRAKRRRVEKAFDLGLGDP